MFTLQTNASDRGVGAVLSQTDENGQEHPVAYFSRKREAHYSTVEKECQGLPTRPEVRHPDRPSSHGVAKPVER